MFTRKMNVDKNGELQSFLKIAPLKMTCEHGNCQSQVGRDYKRLPGEIEAGWEDEPIFLCEEHSKGHEPV
jgi:hypothetical protein